MKRIANIYDIYDEEKNLAVYDTDMLSEMLENDLIDDIEEGFMRGYIAG